LLSRLAGIARTPSRRAALSCSSIARRYKNGDTANLAALSNVPDRIKMLTGGDLYAAAPTYLDTDQYVKVILMPEPDAQRRRGT
jgi:hypothetical protein